METSNNEKFKPEWQKNSDYPARKIVIKEIRKIFKKRCPNPSQSLIEKLPEIIKELEVSLYKSAKSLEEYADLETIEGRLIDIAKDVSVLNKAAQILLGMSGFQNSQVISINPNSSNGEQEEQNPDQSKGQGSGVRRS
jgi:hypothetical protein